MRGSIRSRLSYANAMATGAITHVGRAFRKPDISSRQLPDCLRARRAHATALAVVGHAVGQQMRWKDRGPTRV
jgi:hypothetical protein